MIFENLYIFLISIFLSLLIWNTFLYLFFSYKFLFFWRKINFLTCHYLFFSKWWKLSKCKKKCFLFYSKILKEKKGVIKRSRGDIETNVIGKIMERVVKRSLMEYVETNKIMADSQHGFWPGRSVQTILLG